jgi:hypothetical protein
MTKDRFAEYFQVATREALEFGQQFVVQELSGDVRYKLYPNQSYDGNPLVGDEEVYPDDSLPNDEFLGPLRAPEVVEYLWRGGKVPEWIDITVDSVADGITCIGLLCCGRYTANEQFLYYEHRGRGPFGVKGPRIPPGWESLEKSGKFDLHW